ncbi:DUF1990 domain-containing protein [Leifsonia lichenia]
MRMTAPRLRVWPPSETGYRRSESSAVLGHGDDLWMRACADVLRWRVKTASGFLVDGRVDPGPVSPGERLIVTARVLTITVREPVQVVCVVEDADRVGFSYRTLPGHPVRGEEAFIVERDGDEVRLVVRSLTRAAAEHPWRALFPLLLVAQRVARRRYLRALR